MGKLLKALGVCVGIMLILDQLQIQQLKATNRQLENRLMEEMFSEAPCEVVEEAEIFEAQVTLDLDLSDEFLGMPSVFPVEGHITSKFGMRYHPIHKSMRFHRGIDIGAPEGEPVKSAGAGMVVFAKTNGGYGNFLVIDHGEGVQSRYAHLSEFLVKEGQLVNAGDVIGLVGQTGSATGPHLHFEILKNAKAADPMDVVARN